MDNVLVPVLHVSGHLLQVGKLVLSKIYSAASMEKRIPAIMETPHDGNQ
jgi:hypothetical protein